MKKCKLYFELNNEENCYPLDYFQDRIHDGEKEIEIELAKIEFGNGFIWCNEIREILESGDGACGLGCKQYKPRNKKSGRCCFAGNTYMGTGEFFILTKSGLAKQKG